MTAILAILIAAVSPPPASAQVARFAMAQAAERISLPGVEARDLVADPLDSRIEVRVAPARAAARLVERLRPTLRGLCRSVEARGDRLTFTCETKRLDARLARPAAGKGAVIELHELRGLPYRDEAEVLRVLYPTETLLFGDSCPGNTPAARGECAWAAGDTAEAVLQFQLAIDSRDRGLAALRLGDIALDADDPVQALAWFRRAGSIGIFGRLAAARLCEIGGQCELEPSAALFSATGLPEPLRTEILLRAARVAAFNDKPRDVLDLMNAALAPNGAAPLCEGKGSVFCRRLVAFALERLPDDAIEAGIELYLRLPDRTTGPLALRLARSTADRAAKIGAPIFAANLFAAVYASVEEEEKLPHLLRAAALFAAGDDLARARAILEYVDSRFPRRRTSAGDWARLRQEISRLSEDGELRAETTPAFEILSAEAARDVAAAWGALSRARTEKR